MVPGSKGGIVISFIVYLIAAFCAIGLVTYWVPLIASRWYRPPALEPLDMSGLVPTLHVLIPCHNGEASLPSIVESLHAQIYPKDKVRITVLVDNCTDNSLAVAKRLGVEVYERNDLANKGKGYAMNAFFQNSLRTQAFDALVLFDVDGRVEADYLMRVARYIANGHKILQGTPLSKNAGVNSLTRVGDIIQDLLRVHQKGRMVLGLQPLMFGGFGEVIHRTALEKLDWEIGSGRMSDDLELGLRAFLCGIPIQYAPDLAVYNDLTESADAIRRQRRRWAIANLQSFPVYVGPLLAQLFRGRWKALDILFGILMLPSFATLFLTISLMFAVSFVAEIFFGAAAFHLPLFFFMLLFEVAYLVRALTWARPHISIGDFKAFVNYIGIRGLSIVDAIVHYRSREWLPTSHKSDAELGFALKKRDQ